MAGLEAQSGELAAQRITDAELVEIKAMHFEMMAAWTRRDPSNYHRLNSDPQRHQRRGQEPGADGPRTSKVNARLQALRFRSTRTKPSGSAP